MKLLITLTTVLISFNLFAVLPADLQTIKDRFNNMVNVDPSGDFDFILTEYRGRDNSAFNLINEVEQIKADHRHNDWSYIETLEVFNPVVKFDKEKMLDEFSLYLDPDYAFYCFNFTNINYDYDLSSVVCADTTKTLLKDVFTKFDTYIIDIQGDWWGNYREVYLYIISKEDPSYAIRLYFDILHEL